MSILSVIEEAWTLVSGLKLPIFLTSFVFPICFVLMMSIVSIFIRNIFPKNIGFTVFVVFFFLFFWTQSVINIMLGVRRAQGVSATISAAISQCKPVLGKLFILSLGDLFVYLWYMNGKYLLGLSKGIPPGYIILTVLLHFMLVIPFLNFAVPLVVTQNQSIWPAIRSSYIAMFRNFIPIFLCYLIMIIIGFIGAIPFGIGCIWTVPMFAGMKGILFRNIFLGHEEPKASQLA